MFVTSISPLVPLLTFGLVASLTPLMAEKTAVAPFEIQTENYPTIGFETFNDLKLFSVSDGSEISLISDIYKSGRSGLKWNWKKSGASLSFSSETLLNILQVKTQILSSTNGLRPRLLAHFLFGFTTKLLSKMFYGSK